MQRIEETLGPDIGVATPEIKDINEAVASLPGQVQAYVVDRDGATLYSTDPAIKTVIITDRPYFSELAKGAKTYVSGLLFGPCLVTNSGTA